MSTYETYYEPDPIYVPYEDGISNRERRSLRGPSARSRRDTARDAQTASGKRIRISRPVRNQKDFRPELEVWIKPVQAGGASRRSLGNLAITLFDTSQQPLRFGQDHTEESLEELFLARRPGLLRPSAPIEVTGTDIFGDKSRPYKGLHIALTLAPSAIFDDLREVRRMVAPELALDDSHQLDHRAHVSLGKVFDYERAQEIQGMLAPVIPHYVQFERVKIDV